VAAGQGLLHFPVTFVVSVAVPVPSAFNAVVLRIP
jgi:hypothetical protein